MKIFSFFQKRTSKIPIADKRNDNTSFIEIKNHTEKLIPPETSDIHFVIQRLAGSRCLFEVSDRYGDACVFINSEHPAGFLLYNEIITNPRSVLKMMLESWVQMESVDVQSLARREILEDVRFQWGSVLINQMRRNNDHSEEV
jgi:hypothetical protein